jgi:hypothetical protein
VTESIFELVGSEAESGRNSLVVRSEDDAWLVMNYAIEHGPSSLDDFEIIFDGWPTYDLNIKGRDWNSTVPTRVMGPLLEVQKDLHRAYTSIHYGSTNLSRLTYEDREKLELVIKVKEGSSDYKADLIKQLGEIGKVAAGKMTGTEVIVTVLGLALVWVGGTVVKHWISTRQKEKESVNQIELSRQETERMRVITEAMSRQPVIAEFNDSNIITQSRILKVMKPGDLINTSGVSLSSEEAREIAQTERAASEDVDIRGVFRVLANDASKSAGFRIKVERISDGVMLSADVPMELDSDQKRLIQKAEWSKGLVLVSLHITGTMLRGKINDAIVYSASEPESI